MSHLNNHYFVIVEAGDDCPMPTQPDSIELKDVAQHIAEFLGRYEAQGYYRNCRHEQIPLCSINFTLECAPSDNFGAPATEGSTIKGTIGAPDGWTEVQA